MIDVQNILDCRAAVESTLGPLKWGPVVAEQQAHVSWPYKGGAIDIDAFVIPASHAMKAHLARKGKAPAKASLDIAPDPDGSGSIAVLRVAYA